MHSFVIKTLKLKISLPAYFPKGTIKMSIFSKAQLLYEKSINEKIDESDMDTIIAWPEHELSVLFACADQVRRRFFEETVDPCSLMNIKSGNCSEDCAFCSQSAHNHASVQIHGSKSEEIKAQANKAFSIIFHSVVSSGRRLSTDEIRNICNTSVLEKSMHLGILDENEFQMLKDAGVVCYNHNIETSRSYFHRIVTTHTWDERVETVKRAKKVGLHVCCGGILGMGETWKERKEFCQQIRDLDIDTVPLNFLNAIPGTRLDAPVESPLEFLKAVSLFRLVMPRRTIKICGGRELHLGPLQGLLFFAGANGYVSGGCLTTSGAGVDKDDVLIGTLGLRRGLAERGTEESLELFLDLRFLYFLFNVKPSLGERGLFLQYIWEKIAERFPRFFSDV